MISTLARRSLSVPLLLLTLMVNVNPPCAFGIDAEHWQHLPEIAKRYYVLGSVEAWIELIAFESDLSEPAVEGMLRGVLSCVKGEKLNPDSLIVTVQKYVNEHPAESDMEMSALVFTAVSQTCTERQDTRSKVK